MLKAHDVRSLIKCLPYVNSWIMKNEVMENNNGAKHQQPIIQKNIRCHLQDKENNLYKIKIE